MTTTADKALRRIVALRDQANHRSTGEAEAATFLAKAREMCAKHGIDPVILTEAPKETSKPINGQAAQEKKYTCRFGCGFFVMHTIDELNACAEKARNANGGNAYTKPKSDPWADLFGDMPPRSRARSNASSDDTYTDSHGRTRTHRARATGSHAYCDHEATKAARARCRKDRGY